MTIGTLHSVVLDTPDIKGLASFYGQLANLAEAYSDDSWITLTDPTGRRIAFQQAENLVPPRWPDPAHPQQMHLDFTVPDLAAAVERALELGATRLERPDHVDGANYVVMADPSGHPFCLCQGESTEVTVADVAIDCPDGAALAGFYGSLLGLDVTYTGPEGAMLSASDKLPVMFQNVHDYQAPRWPDPQYPQQFHLDVKVADLDEAEKQVLALGASKLPGGGADFRVYADPVGHPFCLVV